MTCEHNWRSKFHRIIGGDWFIVWYCIQEEKEFKVEPDPHYRSAKV